MPQNLQGSAWRVYFCCLSLLGDDASMAQAPSVPLRADVEHEESDRAAKAPTYDDAR